MIFLIEFESKRYSIEQNEKIEGFRGTETNVQKKRKIKTANKQ